MSTLVESTASYDLRMNCPPNCPGCHFASRGYADIVDVKIKQLLRLYPSLNKVFEGATLPEDDMRIGYRNRIMLHAKYDQKRWNFGLINRRMDFFALNDCPIQHPVINHMLNKLRNLPEPEQFPLVFVIQTLRQLILVLKTKEIPNEDVLRKLEAIAAEGNLEGLHLHLNPSAGKKVILKSVLHTVYGNRLSTDEDGWAYSALSFRQLNLPLYLKSINCAGDILKSHQVKTVVDLFSGIGLSMRHWLESGMEVCGTEISHDAVECSLINAPGAVVFAGKCHQRMVQIKEWLKIRQNNPTGYYVNPPRSGLGELLCQLMAETGPETIVYLSCNARSLSEDLQRLEGLGYRATMAHLYDFFPYTWHTECLAAFRKC